MKKRKIMGGLALSTLASAAIAAPGFLVTPTGQATGNTCQSYALGVALAFKNDPAFRLTTAAELRGAELAIRSEIAKASKGAPVTHDHIKAGFDAYTGGRYKVVMQDVKLSEVGVFASKRTGVTSATALPPTNFLPGPIKNVVLSSAVKIGADNYSAGHIFAVLGVDGPPSSTQPFLLLNSAVKIKDTQRNTCTEGLPDDPGAYTALLSWKPVSEIKFKEFTPGMARVWTIEKP